jgi:peptide/nickel transport system permease protein
MAKYLLRRLLTWLVMMILAVNLTYFIAASFLDPAANYVGRRPPLTPQAIQASLKPYNLSTDVPMIHRWWNWLIDVLHWNWGQSPIGESVNAQVAFRIGVSAQLVLIATIMAFIVGIALGVIAASRQYKPTDWIIQGVSIVGINTSMILVAFVVVFLAIKFNDAVGHRVFYVTGMESQGLTGFAVIPDRLAHVVLPAFCIFFINFASYTMVQRSLLLDNLGADYVRTARAKGLTKGQAIRKHALRTSILPNVINLAFSMPAAFTGAMISETIFAWNGMGRYTVYTIQRNDVNGAVACAAFAALMTVIGAVLSDLCTVALDPRVRVS